MKCQKTINLLEKTPSQSAKFWTKSCVKINDGEHGMFNTNSQIKFKTSMFRLSVCDYSDAYILVSGTITVAEVVAGRGNNNKQSAFKNCAPFTDYISERNKQYTNR